jgi:hypothetical protein
MSDNNIWTEEWDPGEDWSGGGARSKRLPRGEDVAATVYHLGPGNWAPFHFHHASEELMVQITVQARTRSSDR